MLLSLSHLACMPLSLPLPMFGICKRFVLLWLISLFRARETWSHNNHTQAVIRSSCAWSQCVFVILVVLCCSIVLTVCALFFCSLPELNRVLMFVAIGRIQVIVICVFLTQFLVCIYIVKAVIISWFSLRLLF